MRFIEQFPEDRSQDGFLKGSRWLMMSLCASIACAPAVWNSARAGAIIRTEFDAVYIQQAPATAAGLHRRVSFGVVDLGSDGKAHKERCATTGCSTGWSRPRQACPTDSIRFGEVSGADGDRGPSVEDLRRRASTPTSTARKTSWRA